VRIQDDVDGGYGSCESIIGAKEAKKDEEKKDHRDLLAEDHPDSMVKI
jgi:hypothetical protein